MELRGKTTNIINRLPDFFDALNTESEIYKFVDVFAEMLETAENDLLSVMKSHHVDTADNFGSQGFGAREKGDLDKIFAFYLEKLGGTSQLIQSNYQLKITDIKNIDSLIKRLTKPDENDLVSQYIVLKKKKIIQSIESYIKNISYLFDVSKLLNNIDYKLCYSFFIFLIEQLPRTKLSKIYTFSEKVEQYEKIINKYLFVEEKIEQYDINNICFQLTSFKKIDSFLIKLITRQDIFTQYISSKLSQPTQEKLKVYGGEEKLAEDLINYLIKDLNDIILNSRLLYGKYQNYSQQINLAIKINEFQILKEFPNDSDKQKKQKLANLVGKILRPKLSVKLQTPLYRPPQEKLTQQYWEDVTQELIIIFTRISICEQLTKELTNFSQQESANIDKNQEILNSLQPQIPVIFIEKVVIALQRLFNVKSLGEIKQPFITKQIRNFLQQPPSKNDLAKENENALTESRNNLPKQNIINKPLSRDDLQRGNRLLLQAIYPDEINFIEIPSVEEIITNLLNFFNQEILVDANFYEQNKSYFQELNLSLETQRLIDKQETKIITNQEIKQLNRLLLEAVYHLEIKKSYDPYRERLKALIKVLKRGAATKQGIIDIIAPNLGIFDDDFASLEAKKKIKIEEYSPVKIKNSQIVSAVVDDLDESEIITINNPNLEETTFTSIQIKLISEYETIDDTAIPPLSNLRIINSKTQQEFISYQGQIIVNKILQFERDNNTSRVKIFYEGTEQKSKFNQNFSYLPSGDSTFYFQAEIGNVEGKFDETLFNFSYFDDVPENSQGEITENQASTFKVEITWVLEKKIPASFRVRIPWDIEGYTDKFDDLSNHPRSQIPSLVNQVKAVGVKSSFIYDKYFTGKNAEIHDIEDNLSEIIIEPITTETNEVKDSLSAIEIYFGNNEHQFFDSDKVSDKVFFEGRFDYVSFDYSIFAISYEQINQETHQIEEFLSGSLTQNIAIEHQLSDGILLTSQLFENEEQQLEDTPIKIKTDQSSQPDIINHNIDDGLYFAGMFDITQFDWSIFS